MAERPIFLPCATGSQLVEEVSIGFTWNPGFAPVQKKKNIAALHASAAERGLSPLLEISTKSEERLGQRLSAFSLKVKHRELGPIPLECAFQGSKVFEQGGPFMDLYLAPPRAAKKDSRIRESGRIVEFRFDRVNFPVDPKTAFYDWLYISALFPHREYLRRLEGYAGFTDIEFNPSKSINCQARSCATLVAMMKRNILEIAIQSPDSFVSALRPGPRAQASSNTDGEFQRIRDRSLFD